ncbi:hypothetical protein P7M35_24565, partial [Vibrio parahaemolyticus]|nr:hypothetical protein [Vibrio parahaemolyticus]
MSGGIHMHARTKVSQQNIVLEQNNHSYSLHLSVVLMFWLIGACVFPLTLNVWIYCADIQGVLWEMIALVWMYLLLLNVSIRKPKTR